jgi:hypothetical protein
VVFGERDMRRLFVAIVGASSCGGVAVAVDGGAFAGAASSTWRSKTRSRRLERPSSYDRQAARSRHALRAACFCFACRPSLCRAGRRPARFALAHCVVGWLADETDFEPDALGTNGAGAERALGDETLELRR